MKARRMARLFLIAGVALVVFLAFEASGLAQCAMCRASLAGSNNAYFIRNFNIGVLVLLTPPVAIFVSIFVVLSRHRPGQNDANDLDGPKS